MFKSIVKQLIFNSLELDKRYFKLSLFNFIHTVVDTKFEPPTKK